MIYHHYFLWPVYIMFIINIILICMFAINWSILCIYHLTGQYQILSIDCSVSYLCHLIGQYCISVIWLADRESIQSTNEHLLQLLSDAVKTYLNVEDTINRKLSSIVTGGQPGEQPSPLLHRRSPPPGKPRSPPGSHPRSPPTGQRPMPPEPSSPGGAEGQLISDFFVSINMTCFLW